MVQRFPSTPMTSMGIDGLWFLVPCGNEWIVDHNRAAWGEVVASGVEMKKVIDLGAYVGFTALLAARHGARVWAVEANPWVFELLIHNIRENGLEDRVTPIQAAVAPPPAGRLVELRGLHPYHGAAGLVQPEGQEVWGTACVLTLPDLLSAVGPVDYLKIDIEGAEHDVIGRGGVDLSKVNWLSLEVHDVTRAAYHREGAENSPLRTVLSGAGFTPADTENLWRRAGR